MDETLLYTKSNGDQINPADMDPVYLQRAFDKATRDGDQPNIDALTPYMSGYDGGE